MGENQAKTIHTIKDLMQYSIVIPAFNEAENIATLLFEIKQVMEPLGKDWEVLVIDDASTDRTWEVLEETKEKIPQLRAIRHAQRSGQSSAFETGFHNVRGECTITLDGDGQNDPHDIPKLLEKLTPNIGCVSGIRHNRQDTRRKKMISRCANNIRRFFLHDNTSDTGCSLKIFRTEALKNIKMYKGLHRFLPALIIIEGYEVDEVPVNHRSRKHGTSKYSIVNRGVSTLTDLFAVWWMRRRRVLTSTEKKLP